MIFNWTVQYQLGASQAAQSGDFGMISPLVVTRDELGRQVADWEMKSGS